MGEIAVIYNPNAKLNRKFPFRSGRLSSILGSFGQVYTTENIDSLEEQVRQLSDQDLDIICICGGDGTNQKVVTSLIKIYAEAGKQIPMLHFLKGGSMNTIGWSMGFRTPAETALSAIIEKHINKTPYDVQIQRTIKVNDNYGFIFGNGVVVNFLNEYYASENSGPSRAAEITYKAISSVLSKGDFYKRLAEKLPATIYLDDKPLPIEKFLMILAGTVEYIGIGFKTLYRAKSKPGYFHVFATALTPGKILAQLHRFFTGKPLVGENHFDELVQEMRIITNGMRQYVFDGEIYSAPSVTVKIGPAVKIVT